MAWLLLLILISIKKNQSLPTRISGVSDILWTKSKDPSFFPLIHYGSVSPSYRNLLADLLCKSIDCFLFSRLDQSTVWDSPIYVARMKYMVIYVKFMSIYVAKMKFRFKRKLLGNLDFAFAAKLLMCVWPFYDHWAFQGCFTKTETRTRISVTEFN